MRNTLLSLLGFLMLISAQVFAQDRTLTGRVSAQDGSILPGVNISLKGTTKGTTTNAQGDYTLNVSDGTTLVYSFIGFQTQEIKVGNQSVLNVSLKNDISQLQEIVVTALGQEKKRNDLVYAAQTVTSEQITQTRNGNLMNALSGKVAGLDIKRSNTMGGSTSTIIRGYKSIKGDNQALYVIDGVPVSNANTNTLDQQTGRAGTDYGNAAADINPDNISSINVLKGAAATALYGSRAANGVILITTKSGKKNSFDVTVNSGVTWGQIDKSTFVRYQKEYGAGYGGPEDFYSGDLGSGVGKIASFDSDASFGPKFDPSVMVYQWDAIDPFSPNFGKMRPWVAAKNGPDTFYETAVNSNQSVNITGGGENSTFKIGYTRNDDKGVLPNSKLGKNLFNLAASYDLSKKLTVTGNVNYSQVKGLGRFGTGYDGRNPNQYYRQWFQTNVDVQEQKEAYFRNQQNITWNWGSPTDAIEDNGPIYTDNAYWSRYQNFSSDTRDNFFGYAAATYKIAPWVDFTGRFAYNGTSDMQEERIAIGSADPGEYERYNRLFNETNLDLIFNFRKQITKDVSFNGLLGGSMRRSKLSSIRASTNGGLVVPNLYSLENSLSPVEAPTEGFQRIGVDGLYGQASFNYKSFINLELTARQDKSTTLPTSNNTYFYPSAGANFVFSELPAFKNNWLSRGKFSINYAEVGNSAPWGSVNDVYDKPTAIGSIPYFSLPNTKNNSKLKSERTKNLEFGIETAFLDDRVGLDLTYYKSNTLDQILPVSVTSATGFTSSYVNSGEVQNQGIEISAFVTPIRTADFEWKMSVNFARNRNEVLSLYGDVQNIPIATLQGGISLNAGFTKDPVTGKVKGLPFGVIRGTNFVFDEKSGEKVVRKNGMYKATPSSAEIIGNPNPDWIGGLSNRFSYKSLSLYFLLDVRHGGDLFSLDQWYGEGTGLYPITAGLNELGNPKRDPVAQGGGVLYPGVNESGEPNTIRAANNDGGGATAFGYPNNPPRAMYIYDASYVKLRELAITYGLPQSVVSKLKAFKAIDVSLIGSNLWILKKNTPFSDPEDGLGSGLSSGAGGYQSGSYPAVKSYGFNVKFRF